MAREIELITDNRNRVWISADHPDFLFRLRFDNSEIDCFMSFAVDAEELKNAIRMLEEND